jgi:hypothetical protein
MARRSREPWEKLAIELNKNQLIFNNAKNKGKQESITGDVVREWLKDAAKTETFRLIVKDAKGVIYGRLKPAIYKQLRGEDSKGNPTEVTSIDLIFTPLHVPSCQIKLFLESPGEELQTTDLMMPEKGKLLDEMDYLERLERTTEFELLQRLKQFRKMEPIWVFDAKAAVTYFLGQQGDPLLREIREAFLCHEHKQRTGSDYEKGVHFSDVTFKGTPMQPYQGSYFVKPSTLVLNTFLAQFNFELKSGSESVAKIGAIDPAGLEFAVDIVACPETDAFESVVDGKTNQRPNMEFGFTPFNPGIGKLCPTERKTTAESKEAKEAAREDAPAPEPEDEKGSGDSTTPESSRKKRQGKKK